MGRTTNIEAQPPVSEPKGRLPGKHVGEHEVGPFRARQKIRVNIEILDRKSPHYPQDVRFWADFDEARFCAPTMARITRLLDDRFHKVETRTWTRWIEVEVRPSAADARGDGLESGELRVEFNVFEATGPRDDATCLRRDLSIDKNGKPRLGRHGDVSIGVGWPSNYGGAQKTYIPYTDAAVAALVRVTTQLHALSAHVRGLFTEDRIADTLASIRTGNLLEAPKR